MKQEVIWNIKAETREKQVEIFVILAPSPKDMNDQEQHEMIDKVIQQFLALHDSMPTELTIELDPKQVLGVEE